MRMQEMDKKKAMIEQTEKKVFLRWTDWQ
jgi:hypothetical protein